MTTLCVCGHSSVDHFAHVGICHGDCGCSTYLADNDIKPLSGTPCKDDYRGFYSGKKYTLEESA